MAKLRLLIKLHVKLMTSLFLSVVRDLPVQPIMGLPKIYGHRLGTDPMLGINPY